MPRQPTYAQERLATAKALRRSQATILAAGTVRAPPDFRYAYLAYLNANTITAEKAALIRDAVTHLLQFYGVDEAAATKSWRSFWDENLDTMYWNLREHITRSKTSYTWPGNSLEEFWLMVAGEIQESLRPIAASQDIPLGRLGDPRAITRSELTK